MSRLLALREELFCISATGAVSIHRFADGTFALSDSFQLCTRESGPSTAVTVVAAAVVMDEATMISMPAVAFREPIAGGGVRYSLGLISQGFVRLSSATLSEADAVRSADASHSLADGPMLLCIITDEVASTGNSQHVLFAIRSAGEEGEDSDDEEQQRPAGVSALLTMLPATAVMNAGGDALVALLSSNFANPQPGYGGSAAAALVSCSLRDADRTTASAADVTSVASCVPAVTSLSGALITCVTAQRTVGCVGVDSTPQLLTLLWVGTSASQVHCCGCEGRPAITVPTPRVPLHIEPLMLQHGSDAAIIAILCDTPSGTAAASTAAGSAGSSALGGRQLFLLNALGETLRSLDHVDDWVGGDFLSMGIPQILVRSPGLASVSGAKAGGNPIGGSAALNGYSLSGLNDTFAQVLSPPAGIAATSATGPLASALTQKAGAMARRCQLLGVAAALAVRLNLGYAAVARMRRDASEREFLIALAQRMIHAQAERMTCLGGEAREARGLRLPAAGGAATHAAVTQAAAGTCGHATAAGLREGEASLLARWRSVVRLKSLPLAASSAPRAATATAVAAASSHPSALRVLRIEHGIRQGHWLLKCTVGNIGKRKCANLAACAIHPSLSLRAEASVTPHLQPSEQTTLTVAVPVASISAERAVDIDLLLTWRAPCGALHAAGAGVVRLGGGTADRAAVVDGRGAVDVWRWQHCLGTRVRFDSSCAFEGFLTRGSRSPSCTLPLPPGLIRSVALLLDAPSHTGMGYSSGSGAGTLLNLPSILKSVLGVQPVVEAFDIKRGIAVASGGITGDRCGGGGEAFGHDARAPMMLAPVATRLISYRCGGDTSRVGDGSTDLDVHVGGTGSWVELILTANGASHDAILSSAAGALRAVVSPTTKLVVNLASATVLHCLSRAIIALQAELMCATKDCGNFLTTVNGLSGEPGEASGVAEALPMRVAALQSETDANMSTLHSLLLMAEPFAL